MDNLEGYLLRESTLNTRKSTDNSIDVRRWEEKKRMGWRRNRDVTEASVDAHSSAARRDCDQSNVAAADGRPNSSKKTVEPKKTAAPAELDRLGNSDDSGIVTMDGEQHSRVYQLPEVSVLLDRMPLPEFLQALQTTQDRLNAMQNGNDDGEADGQVSNQEQAPSSAVDVVIDAFIDEADDELSLASSEEGFLDDSQNEAMDGGSDEPMIVILNDPTRTVFDFGEFARPQQSPERPSSALF